MSVGNYSGWEGKNGLFKACTVSFKQGTKYYVPMTIVQGRYFQHGLPSTQSHKICEWVNTYHAILYLGVMKTSCAWYMSPTLYILSRCLINGCTALVLMEKGTRVLTHPHFFPDPTLPKRKHFTSAGDELGKAFEVSGRPQRNALSA